jgi:hypothetical protein
MRLRFRPSTERRRAFIQNLHKLGAQKESIHAQLRERDVEAANDVDKLMQVLPYAGLHGERDRYDDTCAAKQRRTCTDG